MYTITQQMAHMATPFGLWQSDDVNYIFPTCDIILNIMMEYRDITRDFGTGNIASLEPAAEFIPIRSNQINSNRHYGEYCFSERADTVEEDVDQNMLQNTLVDAICNRHGLHDQQLSDVDGDNENELQHNFVLQSGVNDMSCVLNGAFLQICRSQLFFFRQLIPQKFTIYHLAVHLTFRIIFIEEVHQGLNLSSLLLSFIVQLILNCSLFS